jgi:serine phosphatase RsbU (regulator of sigma subunit)
MMALFFAVLPAHAQQKKETKDTTLDSLETALLQAKGDTSKVRILFATTNYIRKKDVKKATDYAQKNFELAKKVGNMKSLGLAYRGLGLCYDGQQGEIEKTFHNFKEAIRIFEGLKEEELLHDTYNEIAIAYYNQQISDKALEYFLKTLKYAQKTGKKEIEAKLLNNIASLYAREEDTENAEKFFLQSLSINKEVKNYAQMASNFNNLGNIYKRQEKYKEAIATLEEMLSLADKIKDPIKISTGLGTLSSVYRATKDYEKALSYAKQALDMKEKANDQRGKLIALNEIANVYLDNKDYANAEKYLKSSLELGLKLKAFGNLMGIYQDLGLVYAKQQRYQEAYEYEVKFVKIKDSIQTADKTNQIIKMKTIYDTEAKEAENQRLKQVGEAQKAQFFWIVLAISSLLGGVVIVAFILYRNNAHKQRLNNILTKQKTVLSEQKEEIQVQNEELRQQQEEITAQRDFIEKQNNELKGRNELIETKNHIIESSIQVALQIQNAMLPYQTRMQDTLKNYFVLNKPKDIVSGDYYWLQQHEGKVILAVIDCVGHGVPGALMSMIAHALLDKVIVLQGYTEPADILTHLDYEVKYALQNNNDNTQGGMDVALVTWRNEEQPTKETISVTFGGAKRPLLVKRPNSPEIEEFGGTRRSVGGDININIPFAQETFELEKGSMLYMFSDGITDQNDIKRNRIGTNKLKQILLENHHLPLEEQQRLLDETITQHMEGTFQRDDIVLIGVKL